MAAGTAQQQQHIDISNCSKKNGDTDDGEIRSWRGCWRWWKWSRGDREEKSSKGGEADDEDRDGDRNRGRGEKMKKEDGGEVLWW